MDERHIPEQNTASLAASAERVAAAAGALEQVLARLEASQESLHAKIDRIIAAIEENATRDQQANADAQASSDHSASEIQQQLDALQRENDQLKAHAAQAVRKTFSPLVSGLLTKNGVDDHATAVEAGTLDRALATLSPEQRIAVKAELARAGMIA
jgi:hypothetical protein